MKRHSRAGMTHGAAWMKWCKNVGLKLARNRYPLKTNLISSSVGYDSPIIHKPSPRLMDYERLFWDYMIEEKHSLEQSPLRNSGASLPESWYSSENTRCLGPNS